MRRKNLIVVRKVEKRKLSIKDPKIKKEYDDIIKEYKCR